MRISDNTALLYAPHFEDGEFSNPWLPFVPSFKRRIQFMLTRNPYPRTKPAVPQVDLDPGFLLEDGAPDSLSWLGHSTVAIHESDDLVLTDPHLRNRIFTVGRHSPPPLTPSDIPANAMTVISHAHLDHLDAGTVDAMPESVFYAVPLGLKDWFAERGRKNVVELDWWESTTHRGWTFTCLPSQHWSQRLDIGFNKSLWCSWLIDGPERRYFFAGDTGYFHGFAEFGRRYENIDIAILPIGAYEPRDFIRYQHMDPQQAYRAFEDLNARSFVPVHWGTFRLSHEPVDEPAAELRRHLKAIGKSGSVQFLAIGERRHLPAVSLNP
ncbi:MAG: MBL fold metallo-hydrolase [Gammaproteobacteria bacterium]